MKKIYGKKTQISIQMFFFILMGAIFVWILFFGYKQITNVNEQLSNQERIEIEKELKYALEYCSDPLNKGSTKIIEFKSNEFNGICTSDADSASSISQLNNDKIKTLIKGGDNIILLNNNEPVGSFFTDTTFKDKCWINTNNNLFKIEFNCD